jgi:hypothetical protein
MAMRIVVDSRVDTPEIHIVVGGDYAEETLCGLDVRGRLRRANSGDAHLVECRECHRRFYQEDERNFYED